MPKFLLFNIVLIIYIFIYNNKYKFYEKSTITLTSTAGILKEDWPITLLNLLPYPFTMGCLVYMLFAHSDHRKDTSHRVKG